MSRNILPQPGEVITVDVSGTDQSFEVLDIDQKTTLTSIRRDGDRSAPKEYGRQRRFKTNFCLYPG
jgi:hypothetical protein